MIRPDALRGIPAVMAAAMGSVKIGECVVFPGGRWGDPTGSADPREVGVRITADGSWSLTAGGRAWIPDPDPCGWIVAALSGARVDRDRLSALAAVFEARPRCGTTRMDPIMPAIRWGGEAPEREAGRRLFGPLAAEVKDPRPGLLPLYPEARESLIRRVPLLAMSDFAGRPVMAQGRGAPLAFRIPIEAALSLRPEDRGRDSVRLALTVREWRDGLFPRGWRRGETGGRPGDWQRVRDALAEADRALIPWGRDGGGFWRMFALRGDPGPGASLDDLVVVDVALPPGSGSGPVINRPALRLLGVDSGPRYRAFLAMEAANWIPGRTRVPNPRTGRFGWTGNRAAYPVFTAQDRRELAFGTEDAKNRTRAQVDGAFENLPGCVILGRQEVDCRTGAKGWRIVPEAAAEAVRRAEAVTV